MTSPGSDRGKRIEDVFDRAIDLTGVDRARYLDEACAGDAAFRREVEALLSHDAHRMGGPEAIAEEAIAEATAFATTVAEGGDPHGATRKDPTVIGRFEVKRKLGEGGMGVVYEAYDARLDRRVAVKLVRAGAGATRARLLREAQAMAKVAHPNVVAIHEVGAVGDELFVAMELVGGETLRGWLARSKRPWRDVLGMFVAAGRGLAAAHAAGIVHRDFKPDNVLVGRDGRPRVVDFGLARGGGDPTGDRAAGEGHAVDVSLTAVGAVLGTPAFMSPEQFEGATVDARSDQFSFAVALHTALFGAPPFEGATVAELRANVLTRTPRRPTAAEVPDEVTAATLRALARRPGDRFASMDELLERIERPLLPEADHDPARGRGKRRVAALLLLVAGVASFGGIGRTDALGYTPYGLVGLALFAVVSLAVIGVAFRKTLAASAYNRRVSAVFAVPVVGFLIHRLLGMQLGATVQQILVGDAMTLAVTSALAGVTVERWMFWGAPVALAYALAAVAWPTFAAPGFGALLLLEAAFTILVWGEKKNERVSGSGDGTRTVR